MYVSVRLVCEDVLVMKLVLCVQERLDFAMKEIIFDLLSVGRSPKTFSINPEVCTQS